VVNNMARFLETFNNKRCYGLVVFNEQYSQKVSLSNSLAIVH
jgi:hypothetical protein